MQEKMIQIRHVPDRIHRTLKARAASAGKTLSDYLLAELKLVVERPTLQELSSRIALRERPGKQLNSAKAIRAERDSR